MVERADEYGDRDRVAYRTVRGSYQTKARNRLGSEETGGINRANISAPHEDGAGNLVVVGIVGRGNEGLGASDQDGNRVRQDYNIIDIAVDDINI